MRHSSLVRSSMEQPGPGGALSVARTLLFTTRLPKMPNGTNLESLLSATTGVRVANDEAERTSDLCEVAVVVGAGNEQVVLISDSF